MDLTILIENPELAKNVKLEISGTDLIAFAEYIQNAMYSNIKKGKFKENEEYMTAEQFADALQVSLVTLWSWDKKNITNPLRIGNQKRYRRSDLERILNQK